MDSKKSKVWVYIADKRLTDSEASKVEKTLSDFIKVWSAHDKPLDAGFEIISNQVIVVFVDEASAAASGCSIDASVHVMKEIEDQLGISLFDRNIVAYEKDGAIKLTKLNQLEDDIYQGQLNGDTIVYNNLVSNLDELKHQFKIPLRKSWQSRFVKDFTKA